jgi:hypothetical protein
LSCDPVRVTGYVDEALDEATRDEVEAHVSSCETCRAQADFELELRGRLRELDAPGLPAGMESRLRFRLRRARRRPLRWLLPVAATVALLVWVRGAAPFVAWELSRDHDHCFSMATLPAKVWTDNGREVMAYFEERGTRLPLVPDAVRDLRLRGACTCLLPSGTRTPHLYYVSEDHQLSLFVIPRTVRFSARYASVSRGKAVRLLRVGGSVLGIVGEDEDDVEAFRRSFGTSVAQAVVPAEPGFGGAAGIQQAP